MSEGMRRFLFWTPRILCILFAVFISMFGLDMFGGRDPWWHQILGFLMHLIPVYILVAVLLLSWRWEWIGGLIFPGLGLFYIYWAWGRWRWPFNLVNCLTIAGPVFLVGCLFLIGWFFRAQIRHRN